MVTALADAFQLKELGKMSKFLGINTFNISDGIYIYIY